MSGFDGFSGLELEQCVDCTKPCEHGCIIQEGYDECRKKYHELKQTLLDILELVINDGVSDN